MFAQSVEPCLRWGGARAPVPPPRLLVAGAAPPELCKFNKAPAATRSSPTVRGPSGWPITHTACWPATVRMTMGKPPRPAAANPPPLPPGSAMQPAAREPVCRLNWRGLGPRHQHHRAFQRRIGPPTRRRRGQQPPAVDKKNCDENLFLAKTPLHNLSAATRIRLAGRCATQSGPPRSAVARLRQRPWRTG